MTLNEMRKIVICVMACLFVCGSLQAQEMKDVFVNMPDSLSGILTKINREDCVDFLDSNMKAVITNRYDRQSELKVLTEDYLYLEATPQSSWEMKLFPLEDSVKVVCWVRTVCAPVCDSKVEFYTSDWQPLSATSFLSLPNADNFFLVTDSLHADSLATLRREADLTFLKVSLSPDDLSLSFTYTTLDFVGKDTAGKLSRYMRPSPLRYEWINRKFVQTEK